MFLCEKMGKNNGPPNCKIVINYRILVLQWWIGPKQKALDFPPSFVFCFPYIVLPTWPCCSFFNSSLNVVNFDSRLLTPFTFMFKVNLVVSLENLHFQVLFSCFGL